jgi:hypothetical protein
LRRNDCNYVAGSVPFSYQSSGSNNTSRELFFNSAAQVDCFSTELPQRTVKVKHHFHTKAQAPTTAPAESFSSTVLHKYRLLFCRAATFNSSGETIASYQGLRAPFSYQSSGSNNSTGQLFFNSAAQVDCFSKGLPHLTVQEKRLQGIRK